MMKSLDSKGLTLIELLVAMAIASIIMGVVVTTYQLQVRGKNTQEILTDMNQGARTGLEIMSKEIRSAACDPTRKANAALVTATVNQLGFTRDISNTAGTTFAPDSLLDGPNEQVLYGLYVDGDGNQNLGRNTGGGWQPLIRFVDALDFQYFDQNGGAPAGITDIRVVEVTIVARSGQDPGGFTNRFVDTAAYTNQQGNVILVPQNDAFRRFLLTASINMLNLW